MRCLETEEFPYYPTDNVWRREEFKKFIQYQGNLWDGKTIITEKGVQNEDKK